MSDDKLTNVYAIEKLVLSAMNRLERFANRRYSHSVRQLQPTIHGLAPSKRVTTMQTQDLTLRDSTRPNKAVVSVPF